MSKTKENPNQIAAIRIAKGLTMARLADDVGTDPSTINKLEKGAMRLSERWVRPIAEALGVHPGDLFLPVDAPTTTRIGSNTRPPRVDMLSTHSTAPNDIPVRGTAAGAFAKGAFQLMSDAIDYVRRPPALSGARNAYALYVEGTSMVPEHNPGDLRFVHPDRPPRVGDSVIAVVSGQDGPEATIGRLLKRTGTSVSLGKHNPEATVELKLSTVVAIHKVLTLNELFGV